MNKKTSLRLVLITLFCLGILVNMNQVYGSKKDIKLDKNTKTIIAPDATDYVWYLNGIQINSTGRKIEVSMAGIYEVKMTGENGEVFTARISVGINADGEIYRIFLIGDSTVCYWGPGYEPLTGWGMMLPYFFDSSVEVVNRAVAGTSAKSFYNDANLWPKVIAEVDSGDFVFIGFGINDNQSSYPEKYTLPFEGFQDYLTLYAEETQAKGGFPVIVTTPRKDRFDNDTTVAEFWGDYPVASRQLAHELGLPLIDIDSVSKPLYESLGYDYLHNFVYVTDDTHFQEGGAVEMARIVAQEISKYTGNDTMNLLISHLKPLYEVATSTNFPEITKITRTASYPEGIPVNLKTIYPKDTLDLLEWQYAEDSSTFVYMANSDDYRFAMGTEPLDLIAFIDDDPQPDCWGTFNGLAYIDDCGGCVGGKSPIQPCNTETTDGIYKLTSAKTGFCIEAGDSATQEYCLNDDSQFWEFVKTGDFYKIKSLETGKYLSVDDTLSEVPVGVSTEEILWRMEKTGTDTFVISLADSSYLTLEVASGSPKVGKFLRLYKRTNFIQQRFILWELNPETCTGYPCVSIDGTETDPFRFTIMPNPATDMAVLEFTSALEHPVSFELFDLQGKRVFQRTNITDDRIEFGYELSKGLYVAKVMNGKSVYTLKFIKY